MKEPSYMIVIPKDPSDMNDPKVFMDNLVNSKDISIRNLRIDEERGMMVNFAVGESEYEVALSPVEAYIPDYVRPEHAFTEEEFEMLDKAEVGLSVCMDYNGDNNKCFHDQLKLIHTLFPELLAVLDCPSEKLLSGKWVTLAAQTETLPAPRYLFTVQAISDGGDEVWLHTHGLKRCGLYELEILCSDKETMNDHYKMIETFALRMLESTDPIEPGDGVFIGHAAGKILTLTAVDWREALEFYPDATLGTEEDRDDDGTHREDTYVLMIYRNEKDEEAKRYTPVQDFNQFLNQNPIYMFSTSETRRMSQLAIERIPYMIKAFENKENTIILKIGLIADEEHWDNGEPQREHIWFELKDVKDDKVVAQLTQEPYYVSGIKEGDIREFPFSDITDWLIFTKECRISPDDAYLLD